MLLEPSLARRAIGMNRMRHPLNLTYLLICCTTCVRACVHVRALSIIRANSGFYRGLLPSLFGVSHGAVMFMAYEDIRERLLIVTGKKELVRASNTDVEIFISLRPFS